MTTTKPALNRAPDPAKRGASSLGLPEQLLTVKQVAQFDNCSEKTVRRAIQSGLLTALRVGPGGRLLRITRAAHAAYRHTFFG